MKLYYYQRRDGLANFGDALNDWLWPQLLPDFFNEDESRIFVGMGTLLNHLLPQRVSPAKQVIVLSTGVGYEKPLTQIPNSWKIYCVRGKLSARHLGLAEDFAITDGAILVRRLWAETPPKKYAFAFMPHIHHANFACQQWQEICAEAGVYFIHPAWSVERVLNAIAQTEVLLAEAMHGAIVADALRVPWIPITTSPRILAFKWQDWCSSVGLNYHPWILPPQSNLYPRYGRGLRSAWRSFQHWLIYGSQPNLWFAASLVQQLQLIQKNARPQLSNEAHLETLTEKLEMRLEQLRQDHTSLIFNQGLVES
ncbi:MAG: polysaccharide pyruvyl transferase family protein [Spirulinaceae cyanobacterium]